MENLDLREILKDVPKGTKLYSPLYGECSLYKVGSMIELLDYNNKLVYLYYNGKYQLMYDGECMLFPSKDQRDWSKFITKPFQNGDVISTGVGNFAIFSHYSSINTIVYHCVMTNNKIKIKQDVGIGYHHNCYLASHKEKEELYNKLQEEGYFWNNENNSVEKYNFKVGDKIQNIITKDKHEIISINHDYYILENKCYLKCSDQNKYTKEKFDITTLKSFDKVLVRHTNDSKWTIEFFERYVFNEKNNKPFYGMVNTWEQCIPYEGNEHLVGTTNECDEYYKTWE